MNCMKCGREIALGQVFCKECLIDMDRHPIAPGTPVLMFEVNATPVIKRPTAARKQKKPEEQVVSLKRWVVALSVLLTAAILGFSLITGILLHRLDEAEKGGTGEQNYSSLDTTH